MNDYWMNKRTEQKLTNLITSSQIDFLTDDCPGGYNYLTSGWKTNSQTYLQPDNFGHT